jgi:catechol-2,3-dioxygenase
MFSKGKESNIDTRGISDHGFIHSIYFRDPNGYVIELTAKTATPDENHLQPKNAHAVLKEWQANKST